MKVSINWLKELVELNKPLDEAVKLINLRTIGTKEVTDRFIELDMKGYNRADLLSLRGVAYELAGILDSKVKFDELNESDYIWAEKGLPRTPVGIEDEELASVQCVAKIEGLKVEKSSKEWTQKLEDSGMRPVNNIVDATNLVMLEYGHPLHAFDAKTVKDDTINVRLASQGETLQTLDGKLRKLDSADVVLADDEKALDVAGVMGGKDTEISESTHTILLSASLFNPEMVRRTANKLGLHSEASKRFYHGLTRRRLLQALDRAIRMYEKLGGKLTALTLRGGFEDIAPKITLKLEKLNSMVGVEFKNTEVLNYLKSLNFEAKRVDDFSWVITPPYYRLDVSIEEDVIEEVARMYGYERIPAKPLEGEVPQKVDQSLFELIQNVKRDLVNQGMTEVLTYSYFSTQVLDFLGFKGEDFKHLVKVANPISAETEYLRQSIWANLVEAAGKNVKQGYKDIAIFEVGKVFFPKEGERPEEKWSLAGLVMNGTDNPLSELYKILKSIRQAQDWRVQIEPSKAPEVEKNVLHPNRFLDIKLDSEQIGGASEIHPRVLDKLGINKRVATFEIFLDKLT